MKFDVGCVVYNVVLDVVSVVTCCYFVHAFHGELLVCRKVRIVFMCSLAGWYVEWYDVVLSLIMLL